MQESERCPWNTRLRRTPYRRHWSSRFIPGSYARSCIRTYIGTRWRYTWSTRSTMIFHRWRKNPTAWCSVSVRWIFRMLSPYAINYCPPETVRKIFPAIWMIRNGLPKSTRPKGQYFLPPEYSIIFWRSKSGRWYRQWLTVFPVVCWYLTRRTGQRLRW